MTDEIIVTSSETGASELRNYDDIHICHDSKKKTSKHGAIKKRKDGVLRKNPQAPRRFKSSYILFFMSKQEAIKQSLPAGSSVGDVSRKSSQLWKALSPQERAYWDHCAEQDKQRYLREKKAYTGPWKIPNKRVKKNPRAPKRPMSSFLYFSKERRLAIKDQFPNMKNTEISSLLGEQWRNTSKEDRSPYIAMELEQRKLYKIAVEEFNREEEARKLKEREEAAAMMNDVQLTPGTIPLPPPPQPPQSQRHYPYYPCGSHLNVVQPTDQRNDRSRACHDYPYGNMTTMDIHTGANQYFANPPTPINPNQASGFRQSPPPIFPAQKSFQVDSLDENESLFTFDLFN